MFEGIRSGVKTLAKGVTAIKKTINKKTAARRSANIKAANEQKARRDKSLPHIRKIAKEYGATVDVLDTDAYIHRGKGRDEVGVHIRYGTSSDEIRARLEGVMFKSSTASKVASGARKVIETAKSGRKALLDSGLGGGSMYGDPKDMWKQR